MSFTALIEDLEALQKAKPHPEPDGDEGDEKIRAAAGEEAAEKAEAEAPPEKKEPDKKGEPDGDEGDMDAGDEGDDEDEEDENPVLGKSFGVTLEDGTEVEAYDATLILKSFDERLGGFARELSEIDLLKAEIAELKGREIPTTEAIETAIKPVLEKQTALIKSLQEQVAALSAQGKGRKSKLNVHEKTGRA